MTPVSVPPATPAALPAAIDDADASAAIRNPDGPAATALTSPLSTLALREPAIVVGVDAPAHAPEWADWLAEIGFLPGETVMLTARARPGGDPLVVRIGDSTFALRQAEAACVRVLPAASVLSTEGGAR